MRTARMAAALLAGCLLVGGSAPAARAVGVADILQFKPKQEGVNCSTPTAQEQAGCQVKVVQGAQRGSSGYVLLDAQGRILRRFFDTNGDKHIDVWSYYLDGVEVYREIDTKGAHKPDHFRWLGANGMKWGMDVSGKGKIDAWRMISAEEVGQEILQAVVTRDPARLQALWISESEIKGLELPANEVARLHDLQKQAPAKFQTTLSKLNGLSDKTRFLRLETTSPSCVPADTVGGKQDLIKYAKATILYENNGKHDWLLVGEMIQVGLAWRIVDAPVPGDGQDAGSGAQTIDPAVQALLDKLRDLDARNAQVKGGDMPGPNPAVMSYNSDRADLLEKVVAAVKPEEREQWIKQVADCLSSATQNSPPGDGRAYKRLVTWAEEVSKKMAGSGLAAYVVFREMQADYAVKLVTSKDFGKVQEDWLARLAKFVQEYPTAEDTPDALLQLGMVSEFVNKEIEAKKWYDMLGKNFANHPMANKARGALRRLELEGKPLELEGPMLQGGAYGIARSRGKLVVVYYWASWNQQCVGDFAKLKLLLDSYGSKGLELVCVNLDNTAQEATAFLQRSPVQASHLFVPGGLESPLAAQYGIMVLPNLFLVDKDGKVLSRTVQVNNLEDEVKKTLK